MFHQNFTSQLQRLFFVYTKKSFKDNSFFYRAVSLSGDADLQICCYDISSG